MNRLIATLLLSSAAAMPAAAQTAVGLSGDRTIVMIDPATATVSGSVEAAIDGRLLGIDYRPGNQTLVGVTDQHAIVEIDPATGAATEISRMDTMLPSIDGPVIVDFNPAADRLRFMSGTVNHRVNVDTGEVTVDGSLNWEGGDVNAEAMPMVVATGYSNSYGKPESTMMMNIDTGLSALIQQVAPNDGVLKTIGDLGVDLAGPVGFDIATTADGENTAWLAANGGLHRVDLATGAVVESWEIGGAGEPLRDLTIWPAM